MGGRSLAQKALRQGFYWPTMKHDAMELVKRCEKYQKFGKVPRLPVEELNVITAPWPFAMWGLDLIGPLPMATRRRKFVIVACDYFTKWVEAEPLASITQQQVEKFLWQNILCRFGIPHVIVFDNGLQLRAKHIQDFCGRFHIKMVTSFVVHFQTNDLVESTNGKILSVTKKKLKEAKGARIEEFYDILWGIRTTCHTGTGETPFNLTFGTEVISIRTPHENIETKLAERKALDSL
ncbi:Integrase, catalytic core [Corchorus olitorius]|uniref:Integrase, catalytic core n=1 Tax=Corchorus olitorius TaxID=93759 RepID=A0A1R3HBU0_9ROSI|nr:Integrase, catalytic core [Corchorus olitorius]